MIPVYKKEQIEELLAESFRTRYKRKDVNITGVLLARPETAVAQSEVVPNLNHWHYRSDFHTEFFCVGYTTEREEADDPARHVAMVDRVAWYFSTEAFNELLQDIESQVGWRYEGGCYLIVANSRYEERSERAWIDYRRSILVNIGRAVERGAVKSGDQLAEHLFSFAKKVNESQIGDPVWEFSDSVGAVIFKRSLIEYLIALLPDAAKTILQGGQDFVVRELESPEP